MLEFIPTAEEIKELLGEQKYKVWVAYCDLVDSMYDMDAIWNKASKEWKYEYKYRRGGKTLCTWYLNKDRLGLLIIFGQKEREIFENDRANYSYAVLQIFDNSTTYHDGKWMMFEPDNTDNIDDFKKLLCIKRRPNKK